jgi:TolA-binding protein
VVVAGGCQESSTTVSAGQAVELVCPSRAAVREPAEAPDALPTNRQPEFAPVTSASSARATHSDVWRELLAAGRLSDGLRAAERANFDRVCHVATAKELLALADAGRLFGRHARAMTALRVLRQRFPGSADAATAAFTLGRISFEKQHDYPNAATWFETYLREQPSGPLMGDSFGRLMEARLRSGDHDRARSDAQQYLRRFPEGPYASEARGILSR